MEQDPSEPAWESCQKLHTVKIEEASGPNIVKIINNIVTIQDDPVMQQMHRGGMYRLGIEGDLVFYCQQGNCFDDDAWGGNMPIERHSYCIISIQSSKASYRECFLQW